jgi:hypothetical protein
MTFINVGSVRFPFKLKMLGLKNLSKKLKLYVNAKGMILDIEKIVYKDTDCHDIDSDLLIPHDP